MEEAGVEIEDYAPAPGFQPTDVYYDLKDKAWRFDIWAENWPALQLFSRLDTQWRVGVNGPIGLDYNVLFHELDRRKLSEDDYEDFVWAIGVLESTALDIFRKH